MSSCYSRTQMQTEFDATDHAILRELQEDGRRSFRAIARRVGVSEGTVRTRVRRIEDAGPSILAFVDPSRLGHSVAGRRIGALRGGRPGRVHRHRHRVARGDGYASSLLGARRSLHPGHLRRQRRTLGRRPARARDHRSTRNRDPARDPGHKFTYRDVAAPVAPMRATGPRSDGSGRSLPPRARDRPASTSSHMHRSRGCDLRGG